MLPDLAPIAKDVEIRVGRGIREGLLTTDAAGWVIIEVVRHGLVYGGRTGVISRSDGLDVIDNWIKE